MDIKHIHDIFLSCGSRITTDSRKVEKGSLFVALKGENFDGNDFAAAALQAGASYCLVSEGSPAAALAEKACSSGTGPASGEERFIVVPDTLKALQELAAYHREHTFHNGLRIPVLALTGTNGKTTTKELIRSVLSKKYVLTATEGNLNNNIGVPLTLLRITPDTEMAVVEMGASHPGDIRELVDIAHPDCGLITNVGRAHLLGFGSFGGVKATKGEMYDWIASIGGKAFVNTSSEDLVGMAALRAGMTVIPYGSAVQNAATEPQDPEHPFLRLSIVKDGASYMVQTHLVGSYNADNVLAALAVGEHFGVNLPDAIAAVGAYIPSNSRSQMQHTARNTLIVDAYNANPSSMAAALDNFAAFNAPRKAALLGDMLELGAESDAEHLKILRQLLDKVRPELTVLVGREFRRAADALPSSEALFRGDDPSSCKGKDGSGIVCFATSDEAAAWLASNPLEGFAVLVKGSRGTRMEKTLPQL